MFSDQVMAHVLNPRNAGPLSGATHSGCVGIPGEGRFIKVHLVLRDGRIERASYECNGCPASIACASLVCQLVCGKLTKVVDTIGPSDVLLLLGGLPEGKEEMAEVAIEALKSATQQFVAEREESAL